MGVITPASWRYFWLLSEIMVCVKITVFKLKILFYVFLFFCGIKGRR